jgi:Flp pilus assembly pilin Flp
VERLRSLVYGHAGQATAEYALILLVVALVVATLTAFVKGGGLDGMFSDIVGGLVERAKRG